MTRMYQLVALGISTGVFLPGTLNAQVRASERGSVSQTVDGTTIAIDYGRPKVRGRTDLFGGEVPWGKVWTPGANWATTFELSHDVSINQHPVPAGQYSVWFEVQPERWTVILDPVPRRFHLMPPPPQTNQIRFEVTPGSGPPRELLTWSFTSFSPTTTRLEFAWAEKTVEFNIAVTSSLPVTVAPELGRRIAGDYLLTRMGPLGSGDVQFNIVYRDNKLVATWESPPNPNLATVWLVSLGAGMFAAGEVKGGELFDIVMDLVLEFTPLEGDASSFQLRALGDQLWGTGIRASND